MFLFVELSFMMPDLLDQMALLRKVLLQQVSACWVKNNIVMPINAMLLQKNTFHIRPDLQDKVLFLSSKDSKKSQSLSKYMHISKSNSIRNSFMVYRFTHVSKFKPSDKLYSFAL